MENFAGVTDRLTARAITPARLRPVDPIDKAHLTQLLMETISKVHQRCREMASLRELDFLQERSPESAKHRLEVREHRVKPGMPARVPALRTRMANP